MLVSSKVSIHTKTYQLDCQRNVEMGLDPEEDYTPYLDITRQDGTGVRFTMDAIRELLESVAPPTNWISEMDQIQDGLQNLTWSRSLNENYKLHDHPAVRRCGETPTWSVSICSIEDGESIKMSQDAWKKLATLEPLLSLHYIMLKYVQYAEKTLLNFFLSNIVYAGRNDEIAQKRRGITEITEAVHNEMSKDLNDLQRRTILEFVLHNEDYIARVVYPRLMDDNKRHGIM